MPTWSIILIVLLVSSTATILLVYAFLHLTGKTSKKVYAKAQKEFDKKLHTIERNNQENYELQLETIASSYKEKEENFNFLLDKQKKYEQVITNQQNSLSERLNKLDREEQNFLIKKEELKNLKKSYLDKLDEAAEKLEKIAQLTKQEAKSQLLNNLNEQLENEFAKSIKEHEVKLRANEEELSTKILTEAMERYSASVVSDKTVTSIKLPSEEMKGRIIGKEGRNIRAFEKASGVEIIIDESPDSFNISCFDPIRREIAKNAMTSLLKDGRIQPIKIEEELKKEKKRMDDVLLGVGKNICADLGFTSLPKELIQIIGRLKFRYGYGQSTLVHCKEVGHISGLIAAELGLNQQLARKAGFFHDIGKAIDHSTDGDHVELGEKIAKQFELEPEVLDAISCHHGKVDPSTPYGFIVKAADSLSAARPGARTGMLEHYIERLTKIEEICKSQNGVVEAYAVASGREVRVMVNPKFISDSAARLLARKIKKAIEDDVKFPGKINVTVIRETRISEVAEK